MSKGIQAAEIIAAFGFEFAGVTPIVNYFRAKAEALQSSVQASPDINPITYLYIIIGGLLLWDVIRKNFFSENT